MFLFFIFLFFDTIFSFFSFLSFFFFFFTRMLKIFFFGLDCGTISCTFLLKKKTIFWAVSGGTPSRPLFFSFVDFLILFNVFHFSFIIIYILSFHFDFFIISSFSPFMLTCVSFLSFIWLFTFGQVKGNARDGRSRHPPSNRPTKVLECVKLILRPWRSQQIAKWMGGSVRVPGKARDDKHGDATITIKIGRSTNIELRMVRRPRIHVLSTIDSEEHRMATNKGTIQSAILSQCGHFRTGERTGPSMGILQWRSQNDCNPKAPTFEDSHQPWGTYKDTSFQI